MVIVVSFVPVICIALFTHFNDYLFIIPALFQLIALLILLKSFFIKGQMIPWFKLDETLKDLDESNFEVSLFARLKALEDDTWTDLVEMGKIIKNALHLLLFSLLALILAGVFNYFKATVLFYVLTIMFVFGFYYLYVNYYQKLPSFNSKENYEKYKKEIEKWLEDEQPKN